MATIKIKGVVKDYAWGNTYYLPSLLGYKESEKPQAEYWMGTHPSGEATLSSGEKLSDKIGYRLPFLFKVLAISSPLSLQCHPNKKQAMEGWERERELREKGEPYNYQDDNEKAEVLCALTPVTALCGFKKYDDALEALKTYIPNSFDRLLSKNKDIKSLFFSLFALSNEDKYSLLDELKRNIYECKLPKEDGEYLNAEGVVASVLDKYSGDIGCVFPLMMNTLHVKPGEALYLEPDTLHAYVKGNGIELMTASDNVLRGGLTPKRIDLKELSSLLYFGPTEPRLVEKTVQDGIVTYLTPSPDFRLSAIEEGCHLLPSMVDGILIVTKGSMVLNGITFNKGEVAFISKDTEDRNIVVNGTVFMASEVF